MGMPAELKLAVADGEATISLNRPEQHDAVNDELHDERAGAWEQVLADPATRVILLRGEGRSFCRAGLHALVPDGISWLRRGLRMSESDPAREQPGIVAEDALRGRIA